MRQRRTMRRSIFENYAEHEIGLRLEKISDILDEQPEILELLEQDLKDDSVKNTGRCGISVESILRCLLLKPSTLSRNDPPVLKKIDPLAKLIGEAV